LINLSVKSQVLFGLFPESIRPKNRRTYKAYDGLNNVFNFGYYVLECRVHKALLKAKLEPYLGFCILYSLGSRVWFVIFKSFIVI
jgi:hypothetical protein